MVVLAVDFLVGETQVIFHCAAGGIQQEQVPQPIRLEAVNASGPGDNYVRTWSGFTHHCRLVGWYSISMLVEQCK